MKLLWRAHKDGGLCDRWLDVMVFGPGSYGSGKGDGGGEKDDD
jgi:hypothetical protein